MYAWSVISVVNGTIDYNRMNKSDQGGNCDVLKHLSSWIGTKWGRTATFFVITQNEKYDISRYNETKQLQMSVYDIKTYNIAFY